MNNQPQSSQLTLSSGDEAVKYLQSAIAGGKAWHIALLEAIGMWADAEETHNGRHYRYLIAGEAFDWLLLAERLCEEVDGLLPDEEKAELLFHGRLPAEITAEQFKGLIGSAKYHQYLNCFYGVTVEDALILAVQDEVRKERRASGYSRENDVAAEAYQRVYEDSKTALLKQFRQEKSYPLRRSITLAEMKEFTYWLFKYRLGHCDKARIASDTKKALHRLAVDGFTQVWQD
ncbi:hypothetical protein ES707_10366 [subsurface metagenome]